MLSLAGGGLSITEKLAKLGLGPDEPAEVADTVSALTLSRQEVSKTLNTLCKGAAKEGALSTTGLGLAGVRPKLTLLCAWL